MKLAVLIPTLNEEENIENITKQIDESIVKYFSNDTVYIVNCDSNSDDRTRELFKKCITKTKKISFNTKKRGKGYNLIKFMNFCIKNSIDFGITIDADIKSMQQDWIYKFVKELNKGFNYVTPLYERSKYDGNLTNQLIFPIISLYSKTIIRQPIGGEFAFDKKFMELFLKEYNSLSFSYGIDICMTLCAINNDLNISSVNLGMKIHKPGINNMKKMFEEVAPALFVNLDYCMIGKTKNEFNKCKKIYSFFEDDFTKRKKGNILREEAIFNLQKPKFDSIIRETNFTILNDVSSETWVNILYYFINKKGAINNVEFEFLTNVFVIRTVTYWNEIANLSLLDGENILYQYIKMLNDKMEDK